MKPIPTMRRGAASVQMDSMEESRATYERSDVCSVQPASVVGEIVVCLELASALRARLGGWTLAEMRERFAQLGGDEQLCDWPEDLNGRS
jgi:chorismate synthase